jgi:hypothetical protein
MHYAWLPYTLLRIIIQHSPWQTEPPPTSKTEKYKQQTNLTPTVKVGVELCTCPGEWGETNNWTLSKLMHEKQQRLSAGLGNKPTSMSCHQHSTEIWRGIKADSGSGVTSQPPSRATSNKHRLGKAQRVKVRVGQQAYLPKQGMWWILELITGTQGNIQTWIAPSCWGRSWPNRAAAEGQLICCLVRTTFLTTLHKLAVLPHLTILTNLVDRRNQILLTTQSPGETTSEFLLVCQYQD